MISPQRKSACLLRFCTLLLALLLLPCTVCAEAAPSDTASPPGVITPERLRPYLSALISPLLPDPLPGAQKDILPDVHAALLEQILDAFPTITVPKEEIVTPVYLEQRIQALMADGFPRSLAQPLALLSLSHPTWIFEPIFVPESWEQVLFWEVDETPARSLIARNGVYTAYRHPENTTMYDTGHYQASREAVAYFMDPRNFINEADIFQFYCFAATNACDLQTAVETVLRGTFMENADAGDGKSYAETFIEVGQAIGLDPIYLAVRARQEQGPHGGMTVGGDAGNLMYRWIAEGSHGAPTAPDEGEELALYNGYYNVFNIQASGTGSYTVLKNAMLRAIQGSPALADQFGEDTTWNTPAKSIWGGAHFICNSYVKNDQNTVYLQKYNVSPDSSRRFWGQYMQNIVAALSEGRSLYAAFRAADALELPCLFRIPVYSDIPRSGCPDPAMGQCQYTAASPQQLSFAGEIEAGEQPYTLPASLASRLSMGDLPTLQATRSTIQGLFFSGSISAGKPITDATLTLLAKNGEALPEKEAYTLYHSVNGCALLQMHYSRPLPDGAQSGDVYTYALTLTLADESEYRRTLTLALLEITAE